MQTTLIPGAAFCAVCGVKLDDMLDLRARSRTPREIAIQGLRERYGEDARSSEDDWGWLRAKISSVALKSVVKEEPSSSEEEPNQSRTSNGNAIVLEGFAENMWALQESIGRRFKYGAPTQKLIDQLRNGEVR